MKLTAKNYFTNKNRYLSNSKVGDWLKDKRFFYEKHILGTVPNKESDPLIIGKAVDMWLTGSRLQFEKNYIKVARRSKDVDGPIQLTTLQYDEIVGLCESVERTSAFKETKGFKKQVILQQDIELGLFSGLCGIPDWIRVKDNVCYIRDLKTSRTINPIKYYYHSLDYGYFRQQAMYQMIAKATWPDINKFISEHIVVEKDPDKIYKVAVFKLDQNIIDKEKENLKGIITDITKEKKFEREDVSFKDAPTLTDPRVALASEDEDDWDSI